MPPTVLVVDDNQDIRDLLTIYLEHAGYRVQAAEDGLAALQLIEAGVDRPCVVLLDLMMPVMSGPDLLRELEQRNLLAGLRVVIMSAAPELRNIRQAAAFLEKPVEPSEVLAVVQDVLRS